MWGFDIHYDAATGYHWRLWSSAGRRAGVAPEPFTSRYVAVRAADRFRASARDLSYEIRGDGAGAMRWVAVAEDGTVVGASADSFDCPLVAREAADEVRRRAGVAVRD